MSYLNHNLPTITCYIRNEFLYNHKKGRGEVTLCDVHSVASLEKHVPLFEAFLENGVNWTRRPIHAFCWKTRSQHHGQHWFDVLRNKRNANYEDEYVVYLSSERLH